MKTAALLLLAVLLAGCISVPTDAKKGGLSSNNSVNEVNILTVKKGDNVKVDYTGTLDDGTMFDTSMHGNHSHPLEFEAGAGQMIKGFDDAVIGMAAGEEKDIIIPPEEAYGAHNPKLMQVVNKSQLPAGLNISVGNKLAAVDSYGRQTEAVIAEIREDSVVMDFNHPLAGKTLHFRIKLVAIG